MCGSIIRGVGEGTQRWTMGGKPEGDVSVLFILQTAGCAEVWEQLLTTPQRMVFVVLFTRNAKHCLGKRCYINNPVSLNTTSVLFLHRGNSRHWSSLNLWMQHLYLTLN